MINFTKHTLPNGLRLFLAPRHETQAMTILFVYGVGSRYETAAQNGLSHFLEHMFFKGTSRRPTTLDISQELDALGAEYNACTSEESTAYYVSAAAEHFPVAFDVLTDMLYGSVFDSAEIEREKGVIGEEIKMYFDNPISYLDEVAKSLVFGNTPLGRDVAGKAETVKTFTRNDFVAYRDQFYGPENTLVVVAGNPGKHDWLAILKKSLTRLPSRAPKKHERQKLVKAGPLKVGKKPIDQVHLNLMHYTIAHDDRRSEIFDVLSNILGGTMSSRLFVEVREKRGLAYYVRSTPDSYDDIGTLDASAGVDPNKLTEAVSTILAEVNRLKLEPVTDRELSRAKQNIRGRLSLWLEDSHSIAHLLAYEELKRGSVRQPEEYLESVEKVSASAIMEVAKQFLTAKNRKLALVGKVSLAQQKELVVLIKKG